MTSDITVSVGLDTKGVVEGVAQVKRSLSEIKAASAETNRSLGNIESGFAKVGTTIKAAFTGYLAKQIIDIADRMTLLNARLSLVSTSQENLASSQARMFEMAQRLRVPLESVAELYVRVSQNAQNLGKSQEQIAKFTEAVTQGFKISGSATSEAAAATRQLSQAMASGVLRGDEFNSIMENAPRLQKALTKELGVTAGELRKMAENGQLLSTKVFDAILKQAPEMAEEFKKIPPTVGDAFVTLKNSFALLLDNVNKTTGATSSLSEAILWLSKKVEEFAPATAAAASTIKLGWTTAFEVLTTAIGVWGYRTIGQVSAIYDAFVAAFSKIKEILMGFRAAFVSAIENPLKADFSQLTNALSTGIGESFVNAYRDKMKEVNAVTAETIDNSKKKIREATAETMAAYEKIGKKVSSKLGDDPVGTPGKPPADTTKEKKRSLDEYIKSLQKSIDTEKASLAVLKNKSNLAATAMEQQKNMAKEQAISKALIEAETKAREDFNKHLRASPKLRDDEAAAIKRQVTELAELNQQLSEEQRLSDLVKSTIEETRTPAEKLAREMDDLRRAGQTALGQTAEGAEALRRKMEQVKDEVNPMAQIFKDVATSINNSFTSMFEDLFSGTKNSFAKIGETIKSMFVKLLAQMATMAIARPIIIPLITAVGGGMGLSGSAIGAVTQQLGYSGTTGGGSSPLGILSNINGIFNGSSSLFGGATSAIDAFGANYLGLSNVSSSFVGPLAAGQTAGTTLSGLLGTAGLGAGIGGLVTMLTGGNSLTGSLGGAAGSILGNFLLPGVGGWIGGALGGALGGMFGGKKPSNKLQDSIIDFSTGDITRGGQTGKKFSQENRDAADTLTSAVTSIAQVLTTSLGQTLTQTLRIAVGARSGYQAGAVNAETSYDTPEALLKGVTKQLADSLENVPESFQKALDKIDFKNMDQALSDLSFALNFDKLGQTVDKINDAQAALNEIKAQFDTLRETAKRLGLEVQKVNDAEQKAIDLVKQQFNEARGKDLASLLSPAAVAIGEEIKARDNLIEQAKTLGVSTTLINAASEIRLKALQEQLDQEYELTAAYQERVAADKERLSVLDDQSKTASDLLNKYKSISDSLGKAIINLRLGNSSTLSPLDKLTEARSLFQTTLSSALGGDTEAAGELASIGDKVVELTRAYYASSQQAVDDINMVENGLRAVKDVADKQISVQTQILKSTQDQIAAINAASAAIVKAVNDNAPASVNSNGFSVNNPNEVIISKLTPGTAATGGLRTIQSNKGILTENDIIDLYRSVGFTGTPGGGSVSRFFEGNPSAANAFRSLAKSLGLPGFAAGGMPPINKPFLVGENGPEIMSIGASSRVFAFNDNNGQLIEILMSLQKEQRATVSVLSSGLSKIIELHEKEVEIGEEDLAAKRRAAS